MISFWGKLVIDGRTNKRTNVWRNGKLSINALYSSYLPMASNQTIKRGSHGGQEMQDNDNDKIRVNPLSRANAIFRTTRTLSYSNFFNLSSILSSLVFFIIPSCELLSVWSRGWQLRKLEQQIQGQGIENIFNPLSTGQRQLSSVLLFNFFSSHICWEFHDRRMRSSRFVHTTYEDKCISDTTTGTLSHLQLDYVITNIWNVEKRRIIRYCRQKICGIVWQNCSRIQGQNQS